MIARLQDCVNDLSHGDFGDGPSLRKDIQIYYGILSEVLDVPYVGWEVGTDPIQTVLWRRNLDRFTRSGEHPVVVRNSSEKAPTSSGLAIVSRADTRGEVQQTLDAADLELAGSGLRSRTTSEHLSLDQITSGVLCAQDVLGELGEDIVRHVNVLVPVDDDVESAFLAQVPGLIALNPDRFFDPAHIAEMLLHESLHQKFSDAVLVRRLLGSVALENMSSVFIPWNPRDGVKRTMNSLRVLSTLHVYTHLLLFRSILTFKKPSAEGWVNLVEYAQRARFFEDCALEPRIVEELGPDAPIFIDWLRSSLKKICAVLSDEGLQIDSDRYSREFSA